MKIYSGISDFSTRLRELRTSAELRQKDLADALGVAQTTIANYEQGTRFPDETNLRRIADHFNVSLDYLLGRTDVNLTAHDVQYPSGYFREQRESLSPMSPLAREYLDLLLAGKSGKLDPSREYVLAAQEKSGHVRHNHLGYPMRSIRTDDYLYIRNFRPERWPRGDLGAEDLARRDPSYAKRPSIWWTTSCRYGTSLYTRSRRCFLLSIFRRIS